MAGLVLSFSAHAQTVYTWTGGNGSFFDPTRWDFGSVPGPAEIALIDNGSTATIDASAGTNQLGTIQLGSIEFGTESGHIIMNGGLLDIGSTPWDAKAVIGFSGTLSTFIMNGGTIFHAGPGLFPGSTTDEGLNGLDWDVGERGLGRFEMHNDAIFPGGRRPQSWGQCSRDYPPPAPLAADHSSLQEAIQFPGRAA